MVWLLRLDERKAGQGMQLSDATRAAIVHKVAIPARALAWSDEVLAHATLRVQRDEAAGPDRGKEP